MLECSPPFEANYILSKLVLMVKHSLGALAVLFCTTCLISPLAAHPGHGEDGAAHNLAAHYLAAPVHAFPLLVGFALLALLVGVAVRGRFAKSPE
jgi:hypothetical protein